MTPLSFEWQWDIEYLIFMGFLYLALSIIGAGLIYAFIKTWLELKNKQKSIHLESQTKSIDS
jgi:hypothetical protein